MMWELKRKYVIVIFKYKICIIFVTTFKENKFTQLSIEFWIEIYHCIIKLPTFYPYFYSTEKKIHAKKYLVAWIHFFFLYH